MKNFTVQYKGTQPAERPQLIPGADGQKGSPWSDLVAIEVDPEAGAQLVKQVEQLQRRVIVELEAAFAKVRESETASTRTLVRLQADQTGVEKRLETVQSQPAYLEDQLATALQRGDSEAADRIEAELRQARLDIEALARRRTILADHVGSAERCVENEQATGQEAQRRSAQARLAADLDRAKAALEKAISAALPAVLLAEAALAAAQLGFKLPAQDAAPRQLKTSGWAPPREFIFPPVPGPESSPWAKRLRQGI